MKFNKLLPLLSTPILILTTTPIFTISSCSCVQTNKQLTITAVVESSIKIENYGDNLPNLEYSVDGGKNWIIFPNNMPIPISIKQNIVLRGNNPNGFSTSAVKFSKFIIDGEIKIQGNIMNLIDGGKGETTRIPSEYCFYCLFSGCKNLKTVPELPAIQLAKHCYHGMFSGCESLNISPDLPAENLVESCYESMFSNTNLYKTPNLNSVKLATGCYKNMFLGCKNLREVCELPAIQIENSCYESMFSNCTALVTPPKIAVYNLNHGERSFNSMFYKCESLKSAPHLCYFHVTQQTYDQMFMYCSNLLISDDQTKLTNPIEIFTCPELPTQYDSVKDMFTGTKNHPQSWTPESNKTYYFEKNV